MLEMVCVCVLLRLHVFSEFLMYFNVLAEMVATHEVMSDVLLLGRRPFLA